MRIYFYLFSILITVDCLAFDTPVKCKFWYKSIEHAELIPAIQADNDTLVRDICLSHYIRDDVYEPSTRNSLEHIAAGCGAFKTAAFLLRHADPYDEVQLERNKEGFTPLCVAINASGISREAYFATLDVFLGHEGAGKAALVGFKNQQSALDCIQERLHRLNRLMSLEKELLPAFKLEPGFRSDLEQRKVTLHHKTLCFLAHFLSEWRNYIYRSALDDCQRELPEVFTKLCELRVDLNRPLDRFGKTILHEVCLFPNRYSYTITRQMLACGANPTLRCSPDRSKGMFSKESRPQGTPLHVACFSRSYACIAALLDFNGCLLYQEDAQGRTPTAYAKEMKHKGVSAFLKNYDISYIYDPRYAEKRLRLQQRNVDTFVRHVLNNYVHHQRARQFGYDEHRVWLPFLNIHEPDLNNQTFLEASCFGERRKYMPDLVPLCVQFGANLNRKGEKGRTLLHVALDSMPNRMYEGRGKPDPALKALLENGADPNAQDEKGRTALYRAVQNIRNNANRLYSPNMKLKHKILLRLKDFKLLLDSGADINAQTKDGDTPKRAVTSLLQHAQNTRLNIVPATYYKYGLHKDKRFLERLELLFSHYGYKEVPTLQFLCRQALKWSSASTIC